MSNKPYGCVVSRCRFYSATVDELQEHYQKRHPDVQLIFHSDGSFTVDLRNRRIEK